MEQLAAHLWEVGSAASSCLLQRTHSPLLGREHIWWLSEGGVERPTHFNPGRESPSRAQGPGVDGGFVPLLPLSCAASVPSLFRGADSKQTLGTPDLLSESVSGEHDLWHTYFTHSGQRRHATGFDETRLDVNLNMRIVQLIRTYFLTRPRVILGGSTEGWRTVRQPCCMIWPHRTQANHSKTKGLRQLKEASGERTVPRKMGDVSSNASP